MNPGVKNLLKKWKYIIFHMQFIIEKKRENLLQNIM